MAAKKVLYITPVEKNIFETIVGCFKDTVSGERVRNLSSTVYNLLNERGGERVSRGTICAVIKILADARIIKRVFLKRLPGEKREAITYEFSRGTLQSFSIEVRDRRISKMIETESNKESARK